MVNRSCTVGSGSENEHFTEELRARLLARHPSHQAQIDFISRLYKHQISSIAPGEVILIYEFTRFHESSMVKAHDLGVVMHTAAEIKFFDFFAEASHDYRYTRAVMQHFWENEPALQSASYAFGVMVPSRQRRTSISSVSCSSSMVWATPLQPGILARQCIPLNVNGYRSCEHL